MRTNYIYSFFVLWSQLTVLCVAAETVRLGPPPEWAKVRSTAELPATPETDAGHGYDYLILDMQVMLSEQAAYMHNVYRVTNDGALQSAARLTLDFNPAHEELTLHHLRVIRDGQAADRLAATPVKIIQQERDLDRHMLNGELIALLVLEDIRVGDVIDYAITRRGWNPVFGGRYSAWISTGWSVPVRWRNFQLIAPAGRAIAVQSHGPRVCQPVREMVDGHEVITWTESNVAPIAGEKETPDWHTAYPSIQLSEFSTWGEVVRWAEPLYSVPDPLPEVVRAEAERLTIGLLGAEEKALALLRFVQQEIRYLGMQLGTGTHRPSPPDQVLARRFGDCKDKVLLFCSLARALGLTAYPALVHTDYLDHIERWLPTPQAFDHVIAVLVLAGGEERWFDPTLSHQAGGFATRAVPDYRSALVVRPGGKSFSVVRVPPGARTATRVEEVFTSTAFDQPAKFLVRTVFTGRLADSTRAEFSGNTPEEIGKNYLNYYASAMPGITADMLPKMIDDPVRNRVTVEESYSVPELWTKGEKGRLTAEFVPKQLLNYAVRPAVTLRTTPLAVSHPDFFEIITTVQLPEDWPVTPESQVMESDAFRGTINITGKGSQAVMKYSWESLADHVVPDRVAQHVAAVNGFRNAVGYTFNYTPPKSNAGIWPTRVNWLLVLISFLAVAAGIFLIRLVHARMPALPPMLATPGPARLTGLNGWLALVGFGLVISPMRLLAILATEHRHSFDQDVWEAMTVPSGASYQEWLGLLIVGEIVGNLIMLTLVLWAATLFFRRHRIFPRVFIGMSVYSLLLVAGDMIVVNRLIVTPPEDPMVSYRELMRSIVHAVIWIPYMLISKRVRNTFTR